MARFHEFLIVVVGTVEQTLPRIFFLAQRSDRIPPNNTPSSEDADMVMVEMGPARLISIPSFWESKVGNQFFTPQPGMPGTAK